MDSIDRIAATGVGMLSERLRLLGSHFFGEPVPSIDQVVWRRFDEAMAPSAVLGAYFSPGFGTNAADWRLIVGPDGEITQHIPFDMSGISDDGFLVDCLVYRRRISRRAIRWLLESSERIGFRTLEDRYSWGGEDASAFHIAVRYGKEVKQVSVDGAGFLIVRGVETVRRLVWLWKRVRLVAPIPEPTRT